MFAKVKGFFKFGSAVFKVFSSDKARKVFDDARQLLEDSVALVAEMEAEHSAK